MSGMPGYRFSPTARFIVRVADWFENRARREFVKRAKPDKLLFEHQNNGPVLGDWNA